MYYPVSPKKKLKSKSSEDDTVSRDWAGITSQDLLTEEAAQGRRRTLGSTELALKSGFAAQVTLGNLCIFYSIQCAVVHSWDD